MTNIQSAILLSFFFGSVVGIAITSSVTYLLTRDRLKQEAQSTAILDGVAALFKGEAFFEVIPGNIGWTVAAHLALTKPSSQLA